MGSAERTAKSCPCHCTVSPTARGPCPLLLSIGCLACLDGGQDVGFFLLRGLVAPALVWPEKPLEALTLEGSYPENGATGASIENLGVKLYFSNNLTAEKAGTANENVFHLYDADGNDLPIKVLYPDKEDGVVLVLLDSTADADGDGNADVIVQRIPNTG